MDLADILEHDEFEGEDLVILQQRLKELERIRRSVERRRRQQEKEKKMLGSSSDSEGESSGALPGQPGKTCVQTPNGNTPADTDVAKQEKLDPALVGMSVGLKQLYSGKEDKRGRFQWQTTIPKDVGTPAEDADTQKWALIVRNVKVYNDPSKVLAIHSVVVQSPLLKHVLSKVLAGYPGVTVGLNRLEFSGKFEPLVHRFTELKAAIEGLRESDHGEDGQVNGHEGQAKNSDAEGAATEDKKSDKRSDNAVKLQHAELLYNLLVTEFQTLLDSSQDMMAKGVMTYEYLWTLFQPGSMIFSRQDGQDRVFRLSSARYGVDRDSNPVYWLSTSYVDYDGSRFGSQKLNLPIRAYNGTRPITSLSSSPLEYHTNREELEAKLIERGAKFESLAGSHFKSYEGIGWRMGNYGAKDKYSVKGRVVIDTYGWNRFNPNTAVYTSPLNVKDDYRPNDDDDEDEDAYNREDYDDDDYGGMPMDGHFADEDERSSLQPLDDSQRLICSPLVRGYDLKNKLWLNMFVNSIRDITFNPRAFDSLVLPESQKELILGFTASQQAHRIAFDDVIEGKGRGIILLLSGTPGTGKTLTAESVAEEMQVPLYVMSAGEVGFDSRHVEFKLQGVFDMVTRWNAILLIDEADVFLEERSLHELERNKLVSIFLRVLEYYEGIMFLTTNRVQTFDAAFQSRIHISLEYPELSIESRRQIWKNFLAQHNVVQAATREKPLKEPVSAIKSTGSSIKSLTNGDTNAIVVHEDDGFATSAAHKEADEAAIKKHHLATQPHAITDRQIESLALMHMNGRQIKNILKTAQLLASRRQEALNKDHITTVLDVTQHLHNATRESERTRSSIFS